MIMAEIEDLSVEGGLFPDNQAADEIISVRINETQVVIGLELLCTSQFGCPRETSKSIALDLAETFPQLFERAIKALHEAFEELGEFRLAWTEVKCNIKGTLEDLSGEEVSDEQVEAVQVASDKQRIGTPWWKLELALKSALVESGIALAQ